MAESLTIQRASQQPSNIPVASPHSKRTSLSISQLSFATARKPSDGAIQPQTTPYALTNTSGPQSSSSSFRTLRSLLPFGPPKSVIPPAAPPPGSSKGAFGGFGSVRRSTTSESRPSGQIPQLPEGQFDIPAFKVSLENSRTSHSGENSAIQSVESARSQVSPLKNSDRELPPLPFFSPSSPLPTNLSTIIEADTSGLSNREIFSLGSHLDANESFGPDPHRSSTPPPQHASTSRTPADHSPSRDHESSILDLSTARLKVEVLDAMMVEDYNTASDWLVEANGVVVDDPVVYDSAVHDASTKAVNGEADSSLDATASDRDTLILPSPISKDRSSVNLSSFDPPIPKLGPPARPDGEEILVQGPTVLRLSSVDTINDSSPSPNDRTRRTSASSPSTSIPQPTRRTGYLTPSLSRKNVGSISSSRTSPERPSFDEGPRRASMNDLRPGQTQTQPPSPLPGTHSPQPFLESTARRPSQSRLAAPPRTPSQSSRRPQLPRITATSRSDAEPVSPSTLTSSSQGTTNSRFLMQSRPSLDSSTRSEIMDGDRPYIPRHRKRSMSLEGIHPLPGSSLLPPTSSLTRSPSTAPSTRPGTSSSSSRVADWMGPRTVKAFAAAGLLEAQEPDHDRRGAATPSHSRFGSVRTSSERDFGSRYTPSRAGSDAFETNTLWGRHRGMAASDTGRRSSESPTLSATTPRTTFSALSTSTSISTYSHPQANMQTALQKEKEKHEQATEALLSALADSQRTTRILREENEELRHRIQSLEMQYEEAMHEVRLLSHAPSSRTFSRIPTDHRARTPPTDGSYRRLHKGPNTAIKPRMPSPERVAAPDRRDDVLPPKSHRRGYSNTSSVFPMLPSNMSMLVHEEACPPDRSYTYPPVTQSPPSPSPPPLLKGSNHGHKRSLSSNGDISPTTVNFSSEMAGSPGSLALRPEHEIHLEDMTNLDLSLQSTELDSDV